MEKSIKKRIEKYQYIDSIRGVAVMLVITVHVFQKMDSSAFFSWFSALAYQGARGVQLFYIVSALTLFLSMNSRVKNEARPIVNFFIRRFFRIAPLFYIAICYYLWQDGFGSRYWLGDAPSITLSNIISTITFTNGLNPYWITSIVPGGWSIAVEMMFYVFLPFIFIKVKNIRSAIYGGILSLMVVTVLNMYFTSNVLISDKELWTNYLFLFFPSQLPVFFLGIILYFIITSNENIKHNLSKPFLLVGLIMFVLIPLGYFPIHYLMSIGFAFVVYALYLYPVKIFVNKITAYMGLVSFSMYLTHFLIIHFFKKMNVFTILQNQYLNFFLSYLLVVLATVFLSTITYLFIEKPGQRIGQIIISKFEKRRLKIENLDMQNISLNQEGM